MPTDTRPRFPVAGDQVLLRGEIVEAAGSYFKVRIAGPGQGFAQYCWVARAALAEILPSPQPHGAAR